MARLPPLVGLLMICKAANLFSLPGPNACWDITESAGRNANWSLLHCLDILSSSRKHKIVCRRRDTAVVIISDSIETMNIMYF